MFEKSSASVEAELELAREQSGYGHNRAEQFQV